MVRFRMFRISVPQFAILSDKCEEQYNIETKTEFKNSADGKAIAAVMSFSFVCKEKTDMILQVACEFSIAQEDIVSMTSDGVITVPKSLLEHFLVHTVGTARGILFSKTEGTPFNTIVLPPIDVTQIVKGDLLIKIAQ